MTETGLRNELQGRLQGKRLHGRYFVDHVVEHGTSDGLWCNYLLAVDESCGRAA